MPGHPLGLTLPTLVDPPDTQAELTITALQAIVADLEGVWTTSETLADGPLDMGGFAVQNIGSLALTDLTPTPVVGDLYRSGSDLYYVGSLGAVRITDGATLNLSVNGGFTGDLAHLAASYNYLNNEYTFSSNDPVLSIVKASSFKMVGGAHFVLLQPDPALAADKTFTLFTPPASAGVALWTVDDTGKVKPCSSGVPVTLPTYLAETHVAGPWRRDAGIVTPAAITADTNDYNPTGLSTATRLRLSSNGTWNLTGLAAQPDGTELILQNITAIGSGFTVNLLNENAGSTAANRFSMGGATAAAPGDSAGVVNLFPRMACSIMYDATLARWIILSVGRA